MHVSLRATESRILKFGLRPRSFRVSVVQLADGKTYRIRVAATAADGRTASEGSSSFQTPVAAGVAATTASSTAGSAKYYYVTLFGMLIAGVVVLCCNCCDKNRWLDRRVTASAALSAAYRGISRSAFVSIHTAFSVLFFFFLRRCRGLKLRTGLL